MMLKSKAKRVGRGVSAIAGAACATLLCIGTAVADDPRRLCADLDLQLITQIEQAGSQRTVQAERLWIIYQSVMSARKLCEQGEYGHAVSRYQALASNFARRPH